MENLFWIQALPMGVHGISVRGGIKLKMNVLARKLTVSITVLWVLLQLL